MDLDWELEYEPRVWQEEALKQWKEGFKGTVKVATGGGKTVFAFLCMLQFASNQETPSYLIVVPTTALLDQWHVSLTEELNVPESQISCYSGEEKPSEPNIINLLVINTARTKASSISKELFSSFLIVDECHRAGSPENSKALRGDHDATLGLSATPERDYDQGFEERVRPKLGKIIYEYSYTDARRDGVLVPFKLINTKVDLLQHESEAYNSLSRKLAGAISKYEDGEVSQDRVQTIARKRASVSKRAVMRVPVAAKLADNHRGERTIIFHESIDAADRISNILEERSHQVTRYHSGVGSELRRSNLRMYRRGLFDVIVTCRALDEGMNVPETQVAIVASSTSSDRQRIQRLGRVLRPTEEKKGAIIYTLFATDSEKERLKEESSRLDGVAEVEWQKISHEKIT
jgi:superfamily II DNA or RNA helicase